MTAKEKAAKLVNQFLPNTTSYYRYNGELVDGGYIVRVEKAKQCAIIAVDEIADAIDWHSFETPNDQWKYWDEVKKEIEAL